MEHWQSTNRKRRFRASFGAGLAVVLPILGLQIRPLLAQSAAAPTVVAQTASTGFVRPQQNLKPAATAMTLTPVPFSSLPGWQADDHLAAWKAFVASCKPVIDAEKSGNKSGATRPTRALLDICARALQAAVSGKQTRDGARVFFETHFQPMSVEQTASQSQGLLTGYYEPLVKGSRVASTDFQTPLYRRPPDLVNVVPESDRGAKSSAFTHMRQTDKGLTPFPTRADIEQGALKGQNLELLYFKDPVDVYFMQVQGSARVELPDGKQVRITYDGKNGYPYTSIGKHLIAAGQITEAEMSLKGLAKWLKADRKRAEPVMWENKSYVFFRELEGSEAEGAMGVLGIPLQPGRSLAVDTSFHAIGTPIYVSSPSLTHAGKGEGFARLMIAHDVGSAIKGPERGDIFFGSGERAEKVAGVTKHPGHFFVLQPREAAVAAVSGARVP